MVAKKSDFAGADRSVERYPIVVHRWFADGEGWAWSAGQELRDLSTRFVQVLHSRPECEQSGLLDGGPPWWFYHHAPDAEPADSKARGRNPSILRAVALPSRPRTEYRAELVKRLVNIPLPDKPGESSQLYLEVPREWLEQFNEKDSTKRRFPADSAHVELEPPARIAPRWLWRILAMSLVALVAAIILVFVWPGKETAAGVSPTEVREKLLKPLGVNISENASVAEVCQRFCQLYCKRGMREHFFPGATRDEFRRARQAARNLAGQLQQPAQKAAGQSPIHPDVHFAKRSAQWLDKPAEAIEWLPDEPVIAAADELTNAVIKVAKGVPEDARGLPGPSKKVTSTNSVKILEHAVVKPLRNADLVGHIRRGEYERWFFQEFRWQSGESFPWDEPAAKVERLAEDYRVVALLFSQKKEVPGDIKSAAEEMHKWLSRWGVCGISKEDIHERPWFVGRCFLEFLSLKHVTLTADERNRLKAENSLVWQQLSKLPEDGWPAGKVGSDARGAHAGMGQAGNLADPWAEIRERLQQLAARLGVLRVATTDSDAALVQRIGNTIADWREEVSRLQEKVRKQLHDEQEKENAIVSIKQEIRELSAKITRLREELQKLDSQLPNFPVGHSERDAHKRKIETKELEYKQCEKTLNERRGQLAKAEEELSKLKHEAAQWRLESDNTRLNELWSRLTKEQQQHQSGHASGEQ
jgi:polyhydroxyalkanoate synthesis regulator phasin